MEQNDSGKAFDFDAITYATAETDDPTFPGADKRFESGFGNRPASIKPTASKAAAAHAGWHARGDAAGMKQPKKGKSAATAAVADGPQSSRDYLGLARRYEGKLDKDADEFIAFAVDAAKRMQQLINDLLTFSRVSTKGRLFKPTDLAEVVAHSQANLKSAMEEASRSRTISGKSSNTWRLRPARVSSWTRNPA